MPGHSCCTLLCFRLASTALVLRGGRLTSSHLLLFLGVPLSELLRLLRMLLFHLLRSSVAGLLRGCLLVIFVLLRGQLLPFLILLCIHLVLLSLILFVCCRITRVRCS